MTGGPLGRIVEHDPRSRRYPYTAARTATYGPVKYDLIHLDQGQLGSCVGNSTVEVLSAPMYGMTVPLDEGVAVDVYSAATAVDEFPGQYKPTDTGTSGLAAAKVTKTRGWTSGYQHAFTVTDALAALQHYPVMTGIPWLSCFDQPDQDGHITIMPGATVRGGHELSVDEYDPNRGVVWFHNHWGTDWGVGGRCSITVADWAHLLGQQGDVTVLIPATQPAPTPSPSPDLDLAAAFKAWEPGILTKFTRAGKLKTAGDAWLRSHGY